uniref:TLDc domain-containing protein n=1 Tax=Macrostomum lignano TaxID=282301 RepID=A0A1I8FYY4_9PLAT
DMVEEFQAYCPKFNSQIFRHSGKQVDIENSIHYAHVDFVDDDTLASAPTDTDLPSSCGHDNAHELLLFDVSYREARRNNLDLNGLDGLASGGDGNGGDTASASLIIYYNTQSEADDRDRERETHTARTYISSLEFGKFSRRQRRQQLQNLSGEDAGLNQLDDGSSDSSCARLVEHLHLGDAHDTGSSG